MIARQVSGIVVRCLRGGTRKSHSLKDQDTGLPNLRRFVELVEAHLAQPGHPFSVIVVKFDELANRSPLPEEIVSGVRRALRPADLLFSSAKGELVALLLNTDSRASFAIASRVKANLNSLSSQDSIEVVRLGVACAPKEGSTGDGLLDLARERASSNAGLAAQMAPFISTCTTMPQNDPFSLVDGFLASGRFKEAEAAATSARVELQRASLWRFVALMAELSLNLGNFDDASRHSQRLLRESDSPVAKATAHKVLGELSAHQLDLEESLVTCPRRERLPRRIRRHLFVQLLN